jgi:tetratricopeptide (TPR) repeat protein
MKLRFFLLIFFCSIFTLINAQQSFIDSLESIIAMNKQDVATAKSMNNLAMEYVRNDVKKAKQYSWSAILLGRQLEHDRTLSAAYSQLVSIYQNEGLLDSALVYLSFLKKLSDNTNGPEADIVHANYFSTAGLYHKKNGKHKEALVFFISSYDLLQRIGNIASASGQAINIGNTYLGLSNYNAALKYNLLALKGFEKIGNKKGQSFCYQNIGECYTELKQYNAALKYVKKSIQLKQELDDKRGLGNAEQALGRIYAGLKNYDKALTHYANAIALSREMNGLSGGVDHRQHQRRIGAGV